MSLIENNDELHAVQRVWNFSRILRAAGLLPEDQLGHYFEKPWKWDREYRVWQARGCPDLDGDACLFDDFARAAEKAVRA